MKKRYKIDADQLFDVYVILEVDHDKLTSELAVLINSFWIDADARLADADEDPVVAVIKLAASWFIGCVLDVNQDLNTFGMQQDFDKLEGWPPNGGHGIRLVDWDGRPALDNMFLEIREVEAPANG